jgi:hypothetical protein
MRLVARLSGSSCQQRWPNVPDDFGKIREERKWAAAAVGGGIKVAGTPLKIRAPWTFGSCNVQVY